MLETFFFSFFCQLRSNSDSRCCRQHISIEDGRCNTMDSSPPPEMTLAKLNHDYRQEGCLGRGGFANVFLAHKKSGRKVALKVFQWNNEDDDASLQPQRQPHNNGPSGDNNNSNNDDEDTKTDKEVKLDSFERELDAILKLDDESSPTPNSVIYFEDWFTGSNFACIVMTYADGGSLAQEIVRKASAPTVEPYTERRIGFYMFQLMQALDFAHQRGVAHMDVKSANVLINKGGKNGHQLVLTDWGSACILDGHGTGALTSSPIESMTELYASPEFQNAFNQHSFVGLACIPVDSFALGCILYELLCCKKMVDLAESDNETLGEYIGKHNTVEHALRSQCLRLPFRDDNNQDGVCYSQTMREMLGSLLDPNPITRFHPSRLLDPLKNHPASPIVADFVSAAHPPCPGVPLTIDNIQLGMFVQRGPDWSEQQEVDGGWGSVGVVTKLDSDCGYTEVTFAHKSPFSQRPSPVTCRIGAGNKFELSVGPTPIKDFFTEDASEGTLANGIVDVNNSNNNNEPFHPGQMVNNGKCMIVEVRNQRLFVAPTEKITVSPLGMPASVALFHPPIPPPDFVTPTLMVPSQDSFSLPATWQEQSESSDGQTVQLINVTNNGPERSKIVENFYSISGGLDIQAYEICTIQRVQSVSMWSEYVRCRETVVAENWGISDEKHLFHGTEPHDPLELLSSPSISLPSFYIPSTRSHTMSFSAKAQFGDNKSWHASRDDIRRMVLSRVELGRARDPFWSQSDTSTQDYHSIKNFGATEYDSCTISNPFQAYPEYIITYKKAWNGVPRRRVLRAVRSSSTRNRTQGSAQRRRLPPRPEQMISPSSLVDALPSAPQPAFTPIRTVSPSIPESAPSNPVPASSRVQATPKTPESPSKVKECVICMERPVTHILIPCGHPCLCEVCATSQGLSRLRMKCPECRVEFRQAIRFYGKVVEDE
jgi:serine/threonine protein kinase